MDEETALRTLARESQYQYNSARRCGYVLEFKAAAEALSIYENQKSYTVDTGVKNMGKIIDDATKALDGSLEVFTNLILDVREKEKEVQQASKSAIGKVKSSVNELGASMKKIDQLANFERLQRQADCLERIATSLERISELEKSGKLEAVMKAMK